ncbi:MAG: hypothetical protein PG978_001053 [Wolbachia endosymbiont of Ctenocephalides felis wCfeF]|nr:MAG: hypothetical protein PG978_001053 [Wolbachia endosymbiont of Ctenocephalides felis wCfeF]
MLATMSKTSNSETNSELDFFINKSENNSLDNFLDCLIGNQHISNKEEFLDCIARELNCEIRKIELCFDKLEDQGVFNISQFLDRRSHTTKTQEEHLETDSKLSALYSGFDSLIGNQRIDRGCKKIEVKAHFDKLEDQGVFNISQFLDRRSHTTKTQEERLETKSIRKPWNYMVRRLDCDTRKIKDHFGRLKDTVLSNISQLLRRRSHTTETQYEEKLPETDSINKNTFTQNEEERLETDSINENAPVQNEEERLEKGSINENAPVQNGKERLETDSINKDVPAQNEAKLPETENSKYYTCCSSGGENDGPSRCSSGGGNDGPYSSHLPILLNFIHHIKAIANIV